MEQERREVALGAALEQLEVQAVAPEALLVEAGVEQLVEPQEEPRAAVAARHKLRSPCLRMERRFSLRSSSKRVRRCLISITCAFS